MKPEDKAVVQQALEALMSMELHLTEMRQRGNGHHQQVCKAITALRQLLEQPEPVAWHDKIMGMEVSMDVSTGDDDIDHRVYGTVYEVIFQDDGGTPDVILAIETERNFTTPPAQPAPVQEPVAEVAGSAGNLHIKFLPAGMWLGLGDKLYGTPPIVATPLAQPEDKAKRT